ncbi:MAG: hypothetical protein ABI456_16535 [Ktedonobacteraceae bacterium]|nr:hypothetical protein [Chloroflexota bacterium]
MAKKISVRQGNRRNRPKLQRRTAVLLPQALSSGDERRKGLVLEGRPFEGKNASATSVSQRAENDPTPLLKETVSVRRVQRQAPQRPPTQLITVEDFTYVRRDLAMIGILSSAMVVALVVLSFILGIEG